MSSGSDDVRQLLVRLAGGQPAASAEQPWDQLQQVLFSPEATAHNVTPHAPESNRLQKASLEESLASNRRAIAVHTAQSRLNLEKQQTNTATAAWIHSTAPIQSRQTKKSREWWPKYHNPQMLLIRQPHLSGATLSQQPTSRNAGTMLTLDLRALAASRPGAAASPLPQAPATCEASVPENSAPWPSADTCSLLSLSRSIPSAAPGPTLSIRPGSAASVGSPAPATPGRGLYSMVLLDASSRQRLLERIPPAFQLVSADHMTICFKPDQAHLDGLPIGRTVRLAAVGVAQDNKRQAVAVEVQDQGIDVSVPAPHVTISTGQRASAKSAGSLLESCRANPGVRQACYTPLEPLLQLQGTVCLKLTNGNTAFSKEAGTLLPSKTNSTRQSSASGLVGRKGRENSDTGDCSQGWKRQGVGDEPHRTVVRRQQEEGAPAKSQHFGEEELNGAGAPAPPSATPTDESSRSPARPHGGQQPAPASRPLPNPSSAAAGDRGGNGGAASEHASGHGSSHLDELLGRLGISRQLLGTSRGAAAPPIAECAARQGVGGASGLAVQHKLGTSADSNSAEHAAKGSRLPELEALLRAWKMGSASDAASDSSDSQAPSTTEQAGCSQCFGSEQPTVEMASTAQASVPITPAAAAAAKLEEVLDELKSDAAAAAEDAESSFWEQLMAGARTEATERPQSSEQAARSTSRHDSACGTDSRASKQDTGESSQLGKRDNAAATGAPGHVPLKPKRPGREAIDRLWCSGCDPPDDGGAATESTSSPQLLPAKLLRRGEAPGDRPLPSKSSGDWLEVSAESSAVPAVAAERGQEEPSGLSNSQDCILDQPRQPVGFKILRPSQTSSKVASASRKMVMFMEEHPDSPAADVGRGAERLAEELVGQVYDLPSEAFADSDVEVEEDVTGDPWWAARKLPSKLQETAGKRSTAPDGEGRSPAPAVAAYRMTPGKAASKAGPKRKKPKPPSRSPAAQTSSESPDLVSSLMDVWHLAGKAGEGTSSDAGEGPRHAAQELPRRQMFSLPGGALQRDSDRRPAAKAQCDQQQRQRQQRQSEPATAPQKSKDKASKSSEGCTHLAVLGPICLTAAGPGNLEAGQEGPADDLGAEGLSAGVGQLVAKFPSIDRTVAHLTLKSHGGDVEEAISFLELTSLTATPGQLTQLGLLPPPELSPPIRVPHPAANGASSRDGGQAASPPADVAAVDGSLADRVLAAADPGEAIELAISGASITLAERQRLQAESDKARRQWERHYQAKGILNEAAAAAEAKGQKAVAQLLRAQAHEQGKLGARWRRQCNDRAFAGSNHGNTNTVKVDLHGMSVDEAIAKLEQHVHSLSGLSSATFILQVITGAGKHSLGGIARLQPAVIDYARTRGLRWGREPGNAGQINVTLSGVQQT